MDDDPDAESANVFCNRDSRGRGCPPSTGMDDSAGNPYPVRLVCGIEVLDDSDGLQGEAPEIPPPPNPSPESDDPSEELDAIDPVNLGMRLGEFHASASDEFDEDDDVWLVPKKLLTAFEAAEGIPANFGMNGCAPADNSKAPSTKRGEAGGEEPIDMSEDPNSGADA